MKNKKCPYCGRRISYFTVFHVKKQGMYKCTRCKKESKIKTDLRLILSFIAVCLMVVIFMIFWNASSLYNNFYGVVIVAAAMTIFYFSTPLFVSFIPLKKYLKKDEKPRYFETPVEETLSDDDFDRDDTFVFNKDVFDRVKKSRKPVSEEERVENKVDNLIDSIDNETYVPVIQDVSEAHASSDAPLQKKRRPSVNNESVIYEVQTEFDNKNIKEYTQKNKKPDGTKYTANRKL